MAALYEAEKKFALAEAYYRRALSTYRDAKHLYGEGDMLLRLGRVQARVENFNVHGLVHYFSFLRFGLPVHDRKAAFA